MEAILYFTMICAAIVIIAHIIWDNINNTGKKCEKEKNKLISVIGNIGAGKTTLLNEIKNNGGITIEEDLDFWNKINMLPKLYADKKRYSYPFQHMVMLSNFLNIKKFESTIKNGIAYIERSIVDARFVFVEVLHEDGDIEDDLFNLYRWQYDEIISKYLKIILPSEYIYIRSKPEECLKRIQHRGRECEKGITIDYLKKIHEKYEKMVDVLNIMRIPVKIIEKDN